MKRSMDSPLYGLFLYPSLTIERDDIMLVASSAALNSDMSGTPASINIVMQFESLKGRWASPSTLKLSWKKALSVLIPEPCLRMKAATLGDDMREVTKQSAADISVK